MGRSQSEVEEEMRGAGVLEADIERIAPHRTFPGGRPSTFMLGDRLDAEALGALVAAHEHKIFLEGVFWNVFSYDQWGVELGKALANALIPEIRGEVAEGAHDPSTSKLVSLVRR